MNVIVLIAAAVAIAILSGETDEHQKHSHDGANSSGGNGGHQPGNVSEKHREPVTEPPAKPDSVPVSEPTNKKD